jgi:hypothetical protein
MAGLPKGFMRQVGINPLKPDVKSCEKRYIHGGQTLNCGKLSHLLHIQEILWEIQ